MDWTKRLFKIRKTIIMENKKIFNNNQLHTLYLIHLPFKQLNSKMQKIIWNLEIMKWETQFKARV